MNQLTELPLAQRALLVVLTVALVVATGWFVFIDDAQESITRQRADLTRLRAESEALSPYKRQEAREALIAKENRELSRIEANRKMLPSREELPLFIDSVKADADSVGLQITLFRVGDTRLEDYYAAIPIEVQAMGTYPMLVAFFRTLALPNKRISNVRDIQVKRVRPLLLDVLRRMGDTDTSRQLRVLLAERAKSDPEHAKLLEILEREAVNSLALMEARFTVYAFSYTGKPAPEDTRRGGARRRR